MKKTRCEVCEKDCTRGHVFEALGETVFICFACLIVAGITAYQEKLTSAFDDPDDDPKSFLRLIK